MTSRDFVYWLHGYFEIAEKVPMPPEPHGIGYLSVDQVRCIRAHLAMVFVHEIDPSFGGPEKQAKLDEVHKVNPSPSGIGGTGPGGVLYRC